MKKFFKIINGILCLGILLVIVGGVFYINDKDGIKASFEDMFKENYEAKTITEEKAVTSFKLDVASEEVEFVSSIDNKFKIDYAESETYKYRYTYNNGVVAFEKAPYKWNINNIFKFDPKGKLIKVFIPQSTLDSVELNISSGKIDWTATNISTTSLKIDMSSGTINISNINVLGNVNIEVSSGKVNLDRIACENMDIKMSSGTVYVQNSIISNLLKSKISSGSFATINTKAKDIEVKLSSGKVDLELVANPSDYTIGIDFSSGGYNISGNGLEKKGEKLNWGRGENSIKIEGSSGKANIKFK